MLTHIHMPAARVPRPPPLQVEREEPKLRRREVTAKVREAWRNRTAKVRAPGAGKRHVGGRRPPPAHVPAAAVCSTRPSRHSCGGQLPSGAHAHAHPPCHLCLLRPPQRERQYMDKARAQLRQEREAADRKGKRPAAAAAAWR